MSPLQAIRLATRQRQLPRGVMGGPEPPATRALTIREMPTAWAMPAGKHGREHQLGVCTPNIRPATPAFVYPGVARVPGATDTDDLHPRAHVCVLGWEVGGRQWEVVGVGWSVVVGRGVCWQLRRRVEGASNT